MTTHNDVQQAIFGKVHAIGLPAAYPGITFTPPDSGPWLEIIFLPNTDKNRPINANSTPIIQGLCRINVCNRVNTGAVPLYNIGETVKAEFPNASVLSGSVRSNGWPQIQYVGEDDGIMRIAVTVSYSG